MADAGRGSQDAAQRLCQMHKYQPSNALWQALLPYVGVQHILLLSGTCREWHELISSTPMDSLSEEVRQVLLPSSFSTQLPLLELVRRHARLQARLHGMQGFNPHIQRLSLDGRSTATQNDIIQARANIGTGRYADGSTAAGDPASIVRLSGTTCDSIGNSQQLTWSPSACVDNIGRWISLDHHGDCSCIWPFPVVVDMGSGQQICLHGEQADTVRSAPVSNRFPTMRSTWLSDGHTVLFHPVQEASCYVASPNSIRIADACSGSICTADLAGARHSGLSWVFPGDSRDSGTKDILCWVARSARCARLEGQVAVFEVPSCRPLYHLTCPDEVLHSFFSFFSLPIPSDQPATRSQNAQRRSVKSGAWVLAAMDILLAPSKEFLGVVWEFFLMKNKSLPGTVDPRSRLLGLSIHSATSGQLLHSMRLTSGNAGCLLYDCMPQWLPGSSSLAIVNDQGLLRLVTPSGQLLWSSSFGDRNPIVPDQQTWCNHRKRLGARFSASPCGRWLVVAEDMKELPLGLFHHGIYDDRTLQISVVAAATGDVLLKWMQRGHGTAEGKWSKSGEACLLPQLSVVLVCTPGTQSTSQSFQKHGLLSHRALEIPVVPDGIPVHGGGPQLLWSNHVSLSPCGRFVMGLEAEDSHGKHRVLHYQVPSSPAPNEDQKDLSPSFCTTLNMRAVRTHFEEMAWHPLPTTCMYGISDGAGNVHCFDPRANRCVWSWSRVKPEGLSAFLEPAQVINIHDDNGSDACAVDLATTETSRYFKTVLHWSEDGSRLAVVVSLRKAAMCCVLHF